VKFGLLNLNVFSKNSNSKMEHLKRLGFAQLAPAGYIKRAATPSKALEANRDGMRIKQRRSLTHAATEIADKTQITDCNELFI
jgi:hypothetical protein